MKRLLLIAAAGVSFADEAPKPVEEMVVVGVREGEAKKALSRVESERARERSETLIVEDGPPGAAAKDGQWRRHGSSGPPENLDPKMFGKKKRGRTSKRERVFSDLPDDPMPWQEDDDVF